MGTVLVVRHGETTWNREGRIQGWTASTLTDRGREQARAVGRRLAADYDVDRLLASDLPRTRETVSLLRTAGLDREPSFSRAWRERDFGDYQGMTRREISAEHPDYDADGSLLALPEVPGGESLAEARDRVREGWESLLADLDGETVVVVTHGGPIRAIVAAVTGADLRTLAREFSPRTAGSPSSRRRAARPNWSVATTARTSATNETRRRRQRGQRGVQRSQASSAVG